jgi:histidine triad (HIT) family protein
MSECIFCRIVRGEIPSRKVFEDEEILAFHDINPQRPVHFMLIPKRHIESLGAARDTDAPLLGRMLAMAGRLATEQGSPDGFRVIINSGRIGNQEVPHLHVHVVGGPEPVGPMLKKL